MSRQSYEQHQTKDIKIISLRSLNLLAVDEFIVFLAQSTTRVFTELYFFHVIIASATTANLAAKLNSAQLCGKAD